VYVAVSLLVASAHIQQGLHAERLGWHLPGFDASHWKKGSPEQGISTAGVAFYRSNLRLNVLEGHDAAFGFNLSAPIGAAVRVQLYVNGYQVRFRLPKRSVRILTWGLQYGKFVPHIGAQTLFPVLPGVLNYRGDNTIGVNLWAQDESGGSVTITPVVTGLVTSSWNSAFDARYLQPEWTKERALYA
jgi:hypothetical protein